MLSYFSLFYSKSAVIIKGISNKTNKKRPHLKSAVFFLLILTYDKR
ncbi:hypothetical protein HMPREF9417_1960 [Haemophilus parainfluenzae ATCC 33392]|nr:hypothetical protein HMPREF9417_1960 [Haemophilus parainfluenzae ATCC 33392]